MNNKNFKLNIGTNQISGNETNLNHLNIVGDIDETTPKCVVREICEASCIKFNKRSIKNIYKFSGYDSNDPRLLARFINPNHVWKRDSLIKAYEFYQSFTHEQFCKKIRTKISYGLQTSEAPENLNCCALYKICKTLKIQTSVDTTIEEMAKNVETYFDYLLINDMKMEILNHLRFNLTNSEVMNLHNYLGSSVSKADSDLLGMMDVSTRLLKPETYTYDEYYKTAETIDIDSKPTNSLEAITLAAIKHKLDISGCENPLQEYSLIDISSFYFPHDLNMKRRLRSNFFSPYLTLNFNPDFPPNFYSERDLEQMCENEGIVNTNHESPYALLQLSCLSENFYHGKEGNIINSETTFLEPIDEFTNDEIVMYGIKHKSALPTDNRRLFKSALPIDIINLSNPMRAFSYGELLDCFSNYKDFVNPANNEIFSDAAINKLYKLTQINVDKNNECKLLGDEIVRIRIYKETKTKALDIFINRYNKSEFQEKKEIEKVLLDVLHCGMYMRNWDGIGDFPLESQKTNFGIEEQINVDHRVTQSLLKLEKTNSFVLNLPLMEYNRSSNVFVTVNDKNEGLTIRDRLNIVKKGETEDGVTSCIRLSSNKLCATAYYYMILIGFHLPFNISEVSHIF